MKFQIDNKIGKRFGNLTVLEIVDKPDNLKGHEKWWLCKCDCGNYKKVRGTCLIKGNVKSCGCYKKGTPIKHGKTKTKEWEIWSSAKMRAKKNNLNFDIEISDIQIPENCPILNIPLFSNVTKKGNTPQPSINSPTLDKIIPELGYIKGNIRIISNKANRLKSNMTIKELKNLILYIEGKL